MLGLSVAIKTRCTFIIRGKFSASKFFEDCTKTNATVVQYIGELLRYINSTPAGEYDTKHNVRMAMGNGLRGSVWKEFQSRFKVKQIAEFYGATEGNASLLNTPGKVGAIGYMPVSPKENAELVKALLLIEGQCDRTVATRLFITVIECLNLSPTSYFLKRDLKLY